MNPVSPPIQRQIFVEMRAVICSPAMIQVMRQVERIAKLNAAVLITGESGTGKELVARAVHHLSMRCSKAWVDFNCAALPEHLMESELFGYEKGAFSGADSPKPGLFELAHGGTLMLDEVGELDPRMQVKLLRVLDGTPYYRLGGVRKVSVDVRIVAATNQDLEAAVRSGKFRSDLFHRLTQIQIEVPPLRQRTEAIEPLAEFLLEQIHPQLRLSPEVVAALRAHPWPGNIRQLRNILTQAAATVEDSVVRVSDLPASFWTVAAAVPQESMPAPMPMPLYSLEEMERQMISQAMEKTGGHHSKAAALLGISRRTLTRRMKCYRMTQPMEPRKLQRVA